MRDHEKTKEQLIAELKELRGELFEAKRSCRILNSLMEYIPEGITIADAPDVTIRRVSKYGQLLVGRPGDVLKGIPVGSHSEKWGIFHADGTTPAENQDLPLTRATKKGEVVVDEEWVVRKPDGTRVTILCNAGPILDEDGSITGGVIAWRDITERKHAAKRIESIARFPDENPNPVLRVAEDGRILYANRGSSTLLKSQAWEVGCNLAGDWHKALLDVLDTGAGREVEVTCDETTYSLMLTPLVDSRYVNIYGKDITERKRMDKALLESEQRIRLKLESVLSPEGDLGNLELCDIIDAPAIRALMDTFYKLAPIPMSIIDLKGKLLVGVGWQDVCMRFHRAHSETCKHCIESDTQLSAGISPGEFRLYKCKNNMWDIATPLVVGGQHMGNVFSGQFFFDDEELDYELFRSQARQYGFNEEEYIKAVEAVPRLSRESVESGMVFFMKLSQMISQLSYSNIKLARSLTERDALMDLVQKSEKDLNRAQAVAHTGSWRLDVRRNQLLWSDETYRIFGIPKGTPLTYETFLSAIHPEDREYLDEKWTAALRGEPYDIEHRIIVGDAVKWVRERAELEFDEHGALLGGFGTVQDIAGRKHAEEELRRARDELALRVAERTAELVQINEKLQDEVKERELAQRHTEATNDILGLATQASSRKEYLDGVVSLIQKWSGCSCVGIRVLDEQENIPYESCVGFEKEFLEKENWLSLTSDNCACIRVILGESEPRDACCMTPGGSFFLNDSAKFSESLPEEELKRFRGVCIKSGFLSVAVTPIRDKAKVVGAVHLADKKPQMVPQGLIEFIESLSPLIGEGISKFNIRDALRRQHDLLQSILDTLPVGVWIADKEGKIVRGNTAGQRVWQGARYVGIEQYGEYKAWWLDTGKRIGADEWALARAIQKGETSLDELIEIECFDGSRKTILNSAVPVYDAQKNIIAGITVNQDITQIKRAEEQLKVYAEKLEAANRELQDFASIASHDLQEPLRKVQKFSDLVCIKYSAALDDAGKDYLKRMQSGAKRMEALLDALLEYSRVTTRANPFTATDLTILAEDVVSDLELFIERKGAKVELGELPVAEVDPSQFMQLLQNLISNGIKYNESERPEVKVYSETHEAGTCRIYVEDNGIGFDKQCLGKIFQPFQRLHGRSSKYEGTGMGLAICKKIVERHGGSITAKGEPGKGSTFIVTLPLKQS